jgi:hypothetical protein
MSTYFYNFLAIPGQDSPFPLPPPFSGYSSHPRQRYKETHAHFHRIRISVQEKKQEQQTSSARLLPAFLLK